MAIPIVAREAALFQAANESQPFAGDLLRDAASMMTRKELAFWDAVIAKGVAEGTTTASLVRQILARQVSHG